MEQLHVDLSWVRILWHILCTFCISFALRSTRRYNRDCCVFHVCQVFVVGYLVYMIWTRKAKPLCHYLQAKVKAMIQEQGGCMQVLASGLRNVGYLVKTRHDQSSAVSERDNAERKTEGGEYFEETHMCIAVDGPCPETSTSTAL